MNISHNRTDRILLLGESGTGKTYIAKKIVESAPQRIICTPHADEWKQEPNRVVTMNEQALLEAIGKGLDEGNLVMVLDDLDVTIKKTERDPRLNYLLMGPRHRGIGWVIISRRTTDLPTLIFKQANKVYIFQTDLPQDLKLFREFYNCEEQVRALNRASHQCLFIDREAKTQQVIIAA